MNPITPETAKSKILKIQARRVEIVAANPQAKYGVLNDLLNLPIDGVEELAALERLQSRLVDVYNNRRTK